MFELKFEFEPASTCKEAPATVQNKVTICAETRICSKCKEAKPFPGSFHRAGLNRSGVVTYRPDCADCHRALDRVAKRLKRAAHRPSTSSGSHKHSRIADPNYDPPFEPPQSSMQQLQALPPIPAMQPGQLTLPPAQQLFQPPELAIQPLQHMQPPTST